MNPVLRAGLISYFVTAALGATPAGALAMAIGGAMWEAGSGGIKPGWRRWVLFLV